MPQHGPSHTLFPILFVVSFYWGLGGLIVYNTEVETWAKFLTSLEMSAKHCEPQPLHHHAPNSPSNNLSLYSLARIFCFVQCIRGQVLFCIFPFCIKFCPWVKSSDIQSWFLTCLASHDPSSCIQDEVEMTLLFYQQNPPCTKKIIFLTTGLCSCQHNCNIPLYFSSLWFFY